MKVAIGFIAFLFTVLPLYVMANPGTEIVDADSSGYEHQLDEGIDAFYQSDWEKAYTIFQRLQQAYPQDARAYFFDAMIPFWQYYFGGKEPAAARSFIERSDKALTVSHDALEANPSDTTIVLMLSGLYGYQSLVMAAEKDYRRALQSGIIGFKYTRQLLKLDANGPKALIGKGIFYYMTGSVPDQLKWLTNFAGLPGDMEEGFQALEQAAASDSYVSNDAKIILSYLYEREGMNKPALKHLRDLSAKYPKNIIFQFNTGRMYEKCGDLSRAKKRYKLVSSMEGHRLTSLRTESADRLERLSVEK
ncbi:tetratricopeptide repeat protein [Fodinibius sp.]|uniref:tetratricopeptide repeat protein n=1 Tax=Fodinibius sp. TaxID=1872440 RepID=UPI0035669AEF